MNKPFPSATGPRPVSPITQKSLASSVEDALSELILSGQLAPGKRVDLSHYASLWQVSITPVRDAAKQLESRGFLKVVPRRGVFVSELTAKEVKDIFDIRIALETSAIRLATPLIPKAEAERALRTYGAAAKAKTAKERDKLLPKSDLLIHSLAQRYCDNTRMQGMMESMTDMVRWCQRTIILHLNEPFLATLPEHIAICRAVCDRDAEGAAQAMQTHLRNTLDRIQTYLDAEAADSPG